MITSKKGEVELHGSGLEITADIGCVISAIYDLCYERGVSMSAAKYLIDSTVKSAFEECKYNKSSANMDDELNMIDAFNKALDEVEQKFRRKNVKRDL